MMEKFTETVSTVYHREYKPVVLLYMNILYKMDRKIFGANLDQFLKLEFYKKNIIQKLRYVTEKFDWEFADAIDSRGTRGRWGNKANMYHYLNEYLKRDQFDLKTGNFEEFKNFSSKHKSFLYKPYNLDSGRGIKKIDTDKDNLQKIYDDLVKSPGILDELVIQHDKMNELCRESVNTIRIFTLKFKDEVCFIGAALRVGNGKNVVDNYSLNGFACALDVNSGTVFGKAVNKFGKYYDFHPVTNTKFEGFCVPMWDDVKKFVKEMAESIDLNYVAWDIAISKTGPVLIEANPHGDVCIIQVAGAGGRKKQYKTLYKRWQSEHKTDVNQ